MAETQTIEPQDLGFATKNLTEDEGKTPRYGVDVSGMKLKEARAVVEKSLLAEALEASQGNVMKAAELLGVSRPTLYDLMKKHNFRVESSED